MTVFLIVVVIMIVIAFVLILPPLFRKNFTIETDSLQDDTNLSISRERLRDLKNDLRAGRIDQQQFDQARSELEQNLAQAISEKQNRVAIKKNSPWLALLLVITLPILAIVIYLKTGVPQALTPEFQAKSAEQQEMPDLETMITALADHLKKTPEDGEGWLMLGRSYLAMNRFKDAQDAFQHAHKLLGDDVSLLADYADAIGRGNNNDLTGAAKPLIEKALKINPDHSKTRWLAGMLAYQEKDYEKVSGFLKPLLSQTEPGSEIHEGLMRLINKARSQSGEEPIVEKEKDPQANVALNVQVSLSDQFKDQVNPDETVFIFAKAVQGPPIPLAVKKLKVKDLPAKIVLDDSLAMRPDLKISNHDRVNINARISKSGNAIAVSGDLQGSVSKINTGITKPVHILIDQKVP